jgi:hypothetical protein
VHLLSMFAFMFFTNSQPLVSCNVHKRLITSDLKSSSDLVSTFNTQSTKSSIKSDVSIDKLFKDLIVISDTAVYSIVHWFPYELITYLETDKEYISFIKKTMSKYSVFFVITDSEKPTATDLWIQQNCRLVVNDGKKLAPIPMKSVSSGAREIIEDYKQGLIENTGKAGRTMKVVVFQVPTSIDPTQVGSVQLIVRDSSAKFSLPIKSLSPPMTCASCSFVLDSAWQYCPKCSKFIEKKK